MDNYQELARTRTLAAEHDRGDHEDRPHSDCPDCAEDLREFYREADASFGYYPGEDRCPIAENILANEAFLTDAEVSRLLEAHGHCR